MERWLVFGASGAIGRFLLARLAAGGVVVDAVTRAAGTERESGLARARSLQRDLAVDSADSRWVQGDLDAFTFARPDVAAHYDVIASVGPLDAFARLVERETPPTPRIVAISSTSVHVKQQSTDPAERKIATALLHAEAAIAASARAGYTWTILRPTLVYGAGFDRNLSRIAALAARLPRLPLPADALGLRQPVHADDVAAAVIAAAHALPAANRAYDLPGGETVDYRTLVERVTAANAPSRRPIVLPWPRTALVASGLRAFGRPALAAMVARMAVDLTFDGGDAARDFGYAPRAFVLDEVA